MPALLINDCDLNSLGFKVSRVEGMGDGITQRLVTDRIPGLDGVLPLATRAGEVPPRQVTVTMTIRPRTSLLALEAALVQLYGLCTGGRVELRDGRDPSKKVVGILEAPQEVAFDPQYLASDPASRLTLRFTCDDPYRYDISPRLEAGITTIPRVIPVGNAPVAVFLEITQATDPVVTLKSAAGITLATMGFTTSAALGFPSNALTVNDTLLVDCDAQVIEKSLSGVVSDAYPSWTTKGSGFLVLDPNDGDPIDALSGVTLEVSSGVMDVYYRRPFA